jgi:hypothetical protein
MRANAIGASGAAFATRAGWLALSASRANRDAIAGRQEGGGETRCPCLFMRAYPALALQDCGL